MSKIRFLTLLLNIFIFIICTNDIKEIKLNEEKRGSLKNDEYDFYKITLPSEINKNGQLVFELEPNKMLDSINNIVSDPNLYISVDEEYPTSLKNTWSSNRFGDETITIGGQYINPFQNFHIGVHCKEKCNYVLKISLVNNIKIEENKINSYTLESKTVMKFSFTTRKIFKELSVNIAGNYIEPFSVYLGKNDPSSKDSLPGDPIFFSGYRFIIKNDDINKNSEVKYNLVIDNSNNKQEINIWLKYDDDIIKIKEAENTFDVISENKANCYNFAIDLININKDIVLSSTLFNGIGFIYINGYSPINAGLIDKTYKKKDNSYDIIQNRAIHLTKDDFKDYGSPNNNGDTLLNFCFYAEKNSSLSMKIYFLEDFKKIQTLNYIYPGLRVEDILPKRSLTRYMMQNFDIEKDLNIYLTQKSGNSKLYLYMMNPDRINELLDYDNFQNLKKSNEVLESDDYFKGNYLYLTKELNKCKLNKYLNRYSCYLNAIVECDSTEDCTYNLFFDHSKLIVTMEPKRTYTNVISQNENDTYIININDLSIKNMAIVLTPITGKTELRFFSFSNENGIQQIEASNNNFLPSLIKISSKNFGLDNLCGSFIVKVEGLSYASYSIYYYTYNEEENEEYLDQDKVSMKLEKGNIIKDIFLDNHRFKVYMYDSSNNGNKENLLVSLIETDMVNSELYIFKDLNDFSIIDNNVYGYLWRGSYRDSIYIEKDDKNYINNDILYIMVFKRSRNYNHLDEYTTFYLGVTDENTPFLLNEGIEFKHQFDQKHNKLSFFYYYIDNEDDLKISFSLYYGHIYASVKIDGNIITGANIRDDSYLITLNRLKLEEACKKKSKCPIYIEVSNDNEYLYYSSFLIAVKSTKNIPLYLKQGTVTKRTILSGEEQHFIVDLKPDKFFGVKISAFFSRGQGEIYVRKVLKSEYYNITNFPDENNYEYMASYKDSKRDFYLIEIPIEEIEYFDICKVLLTVKGVFPGYYTSTKIEYSISISNNLNELVPDRSYKLFISQGEIIQYHFYVKTNKKRLYISMSNKEQDANMYLNYEVYSSSISEYRWVNRGTYNEFIDISLDDPFFVKKHMKDIDGDYYLAIQGLNDCFFTLYISTQDVKILTLENNSPASCSCETKNDYCYFRYENINDPYFREVKEQNIVFYTEFTYGSGSIFGKIYPNGNMEEIMNSLPTLQNNDYMGDESDEFLFVYLNKNNPKYTFSSVLVVGVQCKESSLFDMSAAVLDRWADISRNEYNFIFLSLNQDNFFYISTGTGRSNKFVYYIYLENDFNFNIKALLGQAKVHVYINETLVDYKFLDNEDKKTSNQNYHHISEFVIDSRKEESKIYYGMIPKTYGKWYYVFMDVKAIEDCLINININYNKDMTFIPLNKEIVAIISEYEYYAYFDLSTDTEEYVVTVTSTDKNKYYSVYLKKNLIKLGDLDKQNKYSKPNWKNYDIKGKTNELTSAVSLKVKNVHKIMRRKDSIVRLFIYIESESYSYNEKIKILVTPVVHNINKIRPQQRSYYFTKIEKKFSDKTLFMLKNLNKDDDLMIIEMSICKGNFLYILLDTPPTGTETYNDLQKNKLYSNLYESNGKKIITLSNAEVKDYYLMVFGINTPKVHNMNIYLNEDEDAEKKKIENSEDIEILFFYYTINSKNFYYLTTSDYLSYESKRDYRYLEFKLPELKKRDMFGKEIYVDYMNYSCIISESKVDYAYMESTCYLSKLLENQEKNNQYSYIKTNYDKKNNVLTVDGLEAYKTYYINILGKNEYTGEILTYKPVIIITSLFEQKATVYVIVFLIIIFIAFICAVFYIFREYRIQSSKMSNLNINKSSESSLNKKIDSLKNINLNIIKKKYNNLSEENKGINDE